MVTREAPNDTSLRPPPLGGIVLKSDETNEDVPKDGSVGGGGVSSAQGEPLFVGPSYLFGWLTFQVVLIGTLVLRLLKLPSWRETEEFAEHCILAAADLLCVLLSFLKFKQGGKIGGTFKSSLAMLCLVSVGLPLVSLVLAVKADSFVEHHDYYEAYLFSESVFALGLLTLALEASAPSLSRRSRILLTGWKHFCILLTIGVLGYAYPMPSVTFTMGPLLVYTVNIVLASLWRKNVSATKTLEGEAVSMNRCVYVCV
ncbi:hypothetical protein KIPB_010849 [Kipferlia bialata]|uniref:Transmembrane protein n=1 Tax=Kipferlia bialata TaxID=797122 RepID=A0A9K3D3V0_9EUKA|nr:hypothetical protein KIPB_010849 [Kipferlia bialata]|eukprot:g10849.t1